MLQFKNINAHIQGAQVLRNVNITLPTSATASIIGRNGAGKTTLFRTLMGLITPTSGTIQFEDKELTSVDAYLRPGFGIGYSPEDRRIFKSFTVEQNLELPAKAIGIPPQEVRSRLENVYEIMPELNEMRQRSGGTVSGGQGKIIALARALFGFSANMLDTAAAAPE